MKILFLDIDSVLNHSTYAESIYSGKGNEFAGSELVANDVPLCKDNLKALKYILDNVPNLKIVWSTDWRLCNETIYEHWQNPRMWLESQDWIKEHVLDDDILKNTPKKMSSTHYEEIRFWFNANEYRKTHADKSWIDGPYIDVDDFAILDDYASNAMFEHFKEHFFQCWWDCGLKMDIASKVVSYFNR